MYKRLLNNSGLTAISLAILVTGIGLIVTAALVTLGTSTYKTSLSHVDDNKAYYIAESGMETTLSKIRNMNWSDTITNDDGKEITIWDEYNTEKKWCEFDTTLNYNDEGEGEGEYKALVEIPEGQQGMDSLGRRPLIITVTGKYGTAQKTLVADIRLSRFGWNWPGLFVDDEPTKKFNGNLTFDITDEEDYDIGKMFVRGDMEVLGNTNIIGDSLEVYGDLSVSGSASISMKTVKALSISEGKDKIFTTDELIDPWEPSADEIPPVFFTDDLTKHFQEIIADPSIQVWDENWDPRVDDLNGIYKHNGNLRLPYGEYSGVGTIIVSGGGSVTFKDIHNIKNDGLKRANPQSVLTIVTESGDIIVAEDVDANIVCQSVTLNGNASVNGTIISKDAILNGGGNSINFEYNEDYNKDLPGLPMTIVTVTNWKEKYGVF